MKKVLVVSLTKFFGGGESFITSHLKNIDGIDFYYIIASEQLYKEFPVSKTILIHQTGLFQVVKQVKKFVSEKEIDVVILNGGRSLFLAPFIHRYSACAGIRHTLNTSVKASVFYRAFYIGALNVSYIFMKAVVHVSQKSKSEQFLANQKAVVIYNGVSVKTVSRKNKDFSEKNFLFVGRLTTEKGVDILIDAFNEICQSDDSIHLHLVGQGKIDKSYPHHANIHFEGFRTDLESYYRSAGWYISLTSKENCSISVLDAMSYGVPVITTNVGGNPELVQNADNGFIIERSKEAVIELFNSRLKNILFEKYIMFSKSALQIQKEKFSLENQKLAYKALLESL